MLNVYVNPDDIWNYFQKNKKRLEIAMDNVSEVLNVETKKPLVKIYLTEENGRPSVTIERVISSDDEKVIAKGCAMSADDCKEIYKNFLNQLKGYDKDFSKLTSESSLGTDDDDLQFVINREIELTEALASFLNILMGFDDSDEVVYGDNELLEILNDIEMMMYQDFGYAPYHPKIIDYDGQIELVEFPYEECDPYGDED